MKIYFMGIGGTAMGNIAVLLKQLGHEVIGADGAIYPPMSDVLAASGITLYEGYDADRLSRLAPDLIVVGNVISRGNPEVEWLLETRHIAYTSLPALMADTLLKNRFNIVVAGTHGKTTTTTLTASLLQAQGLDCGYFIGGVPLGLASGAHQGNPPAPFVIEGDEYDSAFFDKRSKFIHYLPTILIINNLELDHTDIFRDVIDIQRSFSHVARLVPKNGAILVNGDDPQVLELLPPITWTKVYTVGVGEHNDLRIVDFKEDLTGSQFNLVWKGQPWATVQSPLPSLFNARNAAMAALSTGLYLYPENPTQLDLSYFSKIKGVKRRQEIIYEDDQRILIEDFGHHPTAIRETLQSLRNRYTDYQLLACFEPRSNTARTNVFQHEFTDALGVADAVFLGAVHRKDRLSGNQHLDTDLMIQTLATKGRSARSFEQNHDLRDHLHQQLKNNQAEKHLVVFFSNGAFGGIMQELVVTLLEG